MEPNHPDPALLTTRSQARSIYRTLQASTRSQALTRARELWLLDT